jgi:hypothetical protein
MADIKIGDRVRIVSEYTDRAGRHVGRLGSVRHVDPDDRELRYSVLMDGDEESDWFHEVELVSGVANREAHVTRAKELLTGTPHTVEDIIRMARFLAGE